VVGQDRDREPGTARHGSHSHKPPPILGESEVRCQ
jgi:hypothetical protein